LIAFYREGGKWNLAANLKAASEGENYEHTQMYPELEQVAREEDFSEITDFFKEVAEVEEEHEERYLTLLKNLKEGKTGGE